MGFSLGKLSNYLFGAGTLFFFVSMFAACIVAIMFYSDDFNYPQKIMYGNTSGKFKCMLAISVLSIIGGVVFLVALIMKLLGLADLIVNILNIVGLVFFLGTLIAEAFFLFSYRYGDKLLSDTYYCDDNDFKKYADSYDEAICYNERAPNEQRHSFKANLTRFVNQKDRLYSKTSKIVKEKNRKYPHLKSLRQPVQMTEITYENVIEIVMNVMSNFVIDFIVKRPEYIDDESIPSCYRKDDIPDSVISAIHQCALVNSKYFESDGVCPPSDLKIESCPDLDKAFECIGGVTANNIYVWELKEIKKYLIIMEGYLKIAEKNPDIEKLHDYSTKSMYSVSDVIFSDIIACYEAIVILIGVQCVCAVCVIVAVVLGFLGGSSSGDKSSA